MTDNTENLVFEILKSIQADSRDIKKIQVDILYRMSRLETAMLSVKREVNDGFEADIHQNRWNDRINERLERIEKRLELND